MAGLIRDAVPADADAICAFWNPQIRETAVTFNPVEKTTADLAAMIRDRQTGGFGFVVAEVGGQVAGFATYSQFRGGQGYATCMEHTIILAPAAIGRGIGRALMAAIEARAQARGAHQMIAGVSGENVAGQRFHAACGYAEIARVTEAGFKFGRFMDLILMRKFLA